MTSSSCSLTWFITCDCTSLMGRLKIKIKSGAKIMVLCGTPESAARELAKEFAS